MITYFMFANGGVGITPDGTLPASAVVCTETQYQNASQYVVSSGAVVAAPASQLLANAQAAQIAALKSDALKALDTTDIVCLRCYKAAVAFPSAWQTYTAALRSIVNGTDTTSIALPTRPTYPSGT